jgi:hypothetical protein
MFKKSGFSGKLDYVLLLFAVAGLMFYRVLSVGSVPDCCFEV